MVALKTFFASSILTLYPGSGTTAKEHFTVKNDDRKIKIIQFVNESSGNVRCTFHLLWEKQRQEEGMAPSKAHQAPANNFLVIIIHSWVQRK